MDKLQIVKKIKVYKEENNNIIYLRLYKTSKTT